MSQKSLRSFSEIISIGYDKVIEKSEMIRNFSHTKYHQDEDKLEIRVLMDNSEVGNKTFGYIKNVSQFGAGLYFWERLELLIEHVKREDEKSLEELKSILINPINDEWDSSFDSMTINAKEKNPPEY